MGKYLIKAVDTAANLALLDASDSFDGAVQLLGVSAPGDGYGGVYVASQSGVPDGLNVIPAVNGVYIRVKNSEIPHGLKYDGITDDSATLQAIIDSYVTAGIRAKIFLPPGKVKINSPITINCRYIAIEGYCEIDARGILSGPAIIIKNDGFGGANFGKKMPIYGAITLTGAGKTTATTGVVYDANVGGSSANATLNGVFIGAFGTGVSFQDQAFGVTMLDCFVHGCGIGLDMDTGFADYGERISFVSGTIAGCDLAVRARNGIGAFHFVDSSIDYNGKHIEVDGGKVFCTNCHIEGKDWASEPMTVAGNGGTLSISQGWIATAGNNTVPLFKCDTTARQGGGLLVDGAFINNAGSGDFLVSGSGESTVRNIRSYDIRQNPKATSATKNLLVTDNASGYAFIAGDTANITSRLSGANITLLSSADSVKSGGTSLKATKTFGSGSAASFNIAVPLNGRRVGWAKLFHKITGAQTGSFSISFGYADILDSPSTPVVRKIQLDSTSTVSVSAPYDWAECRGGEPINSAPAWATHFVINVNLFSIGAGSIYFDGIEVYEGY